MDYLDHSGVKGMKWGERRWQNPDGTWTEAGKIRRRVGVKSRRQSDGYSERPHSDFNMDSWGKSKDTNILWVTGLPGSGKSSIANDIAKKNNADVINIDLYTFKTADKYVSQMSKSFNSYLDKNVPDWKERQKLAYSVLTKNDRRKAKAAGEWFDIFEQSLRNYGSEMYGKRKVVAEGVQLLDETLFYNNKQGLKGQPLILVDTSMEDSLISRVKRDNKSIEKLLEPERLKQLNTFAKGKKELEWIFHDDLDSEDEYYDLESDTDILMHYGMKYRSGRYPYGSGDNPYQHDPGYPFGNLRDFINDYDKAVKGGATEKQMADEYGLTLRQLRAFAKLARAERIADRDNTIVAMHDKGVNNSEIARKLGVTEGTVRNAIKNQDNAKQSAVRKTADFLKQQIDEKGMIDVGKGVELDIGVTSTNLNDAILVLRAEGYPVYPRKVQQATNPGQYTTLMIACPPGTEYKDVYDSDNIHSITEYTADPNVESGFRKFQYPASMDSSRIEINYAETGGKTKDGLIEIRRGVKDLYLGDGVHYSQVRILVDGTHYLKGMARYADDLPDGIDIRFNTNKHEGTPMKGDKIKSVLKPIKKDPTNPFGSTISPKGQSEWEDENGKKHLSLINKRQDEGEWDEWSAELPSQFLAKQRMPLVNRQLDISMKEKKAEYDEIMSIDNPTVKKQLLETFANDCDSAASHLKAASLPRQRYQVILPLSDIRDDEIYAPNFKDGEKVALVRFPYAGPFECPLLTVNNKSKEGIRTITPSALDAVGISSRVAEQLSGADFDGDTVLVIPTGKNKAMDIRTGKPLKGLEDFDDKEAYPYVKGMKLLSKENTQKQMGIVSNLIMDMTIKGASEEEMTRAVKHSMVIIDAEKHMLNYTLSEKENGIAELKARYKGHTKDDGKYSEGASTLLTKAGSETTQPLSRGTPLTNLKGKSWYDPNRPEGALIYKTASDKDRFWTDKKGKVHERFRSSDQMSDTDDPYTLISEYDTPVERAYAKYASFCKSLANTARKEIFNTGKIEYNKAAAERYSAEVSSLKAKLNNAEKNASRERMAQLRAESEIKRRMDIFKENNPGAKRSEISKERKKYGQQAIERTRDEVGAKGAHLDFTDNEWEAIQNGAIHETTLKKLLRYADIDKVRARATPKERTSITQNQINRIEALKARGKTTAQIAEAVGVSPSTVIRYLKGED